jgi:hypothetical protein
MVENWNATGVVGRRAPSEKADVGTRERELDEPSTLAIGAKREIRNHPDAILSTGLAARLLDAMIQAKVTHGGAQVMSSHRRWVLP